MDELWGHGQEKSGKELQFYELLIKEMMEKKQDNETPDTTAGATSIEVQDTGVWYIKTLNL